MNEKNEIVVPFIDLKRTTKKIKDEVMAEWSTLTDDCEFVSGRRVIQLEKTLSRQLEVQHSLACANGTDAILIALQAAGVKPGDLVALPNLTFWATYEAVAQLGAQPILIDIDSDDLQMSLNEYKNAYDKYRFKYSILVHLFGWASNSLDQFREFSKNNSICMIEDAAQAFGVKFNGKSVFTDAEISTTSFYPAKVIGGCMDGGAIFTNNSNLLDKMRSLCNHGRSKHYSYQYVGWNSRMAELQGAFILKIIDCVEDILNSRRDAFQLYIKLLETNANISLFKPGKNCVGNGYLNVFTINDNVIESVCTQLKSKNIGFGRTYPETMSAQIPAQNAIRMGDLKTSNEFCKKALNLPLFAYITENEVRYSAKHLLESLKST